MGGLGKQVDGVLFVFFLVIAVSAPFLDPPTCLPHHLLPPLVVEVKSWYTQQSGDYLFIEKPHFFVGLVWVELIFQWPLAVASLYAIAARKSWLNTTCLMYGASCLTTMVAVLAEMILSKRASAKMLMMYIPFLGFSVLILLRGFLVHSDKSRDLLQQSKKRA